jgi:hypothetical protein
MSTPTLLPCHIAYDSVTHRLYLNRNKGYEMCLDINFARLRKIKLIEFGGSKYGFALSVKGQQIFFFTPSKMLQQQWVRTLRRSCIFADIEQDYSIEEQIGSGGFSTVHIARRKSDGKRFAVKIIDTKLIKKDKRHCRVMNDEVDIHRRLRHVNIVPLKGVYESANRVYLVMKLVNAGQTWKTV